MGSVVSLVPQAPPDLNIPAYLRELADGFEDGTYSMPDSFVWVAEGESLSTGVIGTLSAGDIYLLLHVGGGLPQSTGFRGRITERDGE